MSHSISYIFIFLRHAYQLTPNALLLGILDRYGDSFPVAESARGFPAAAGQAGPAAPAAPAGRRGEAGLSAERGQAGATDAKSSNELKPVSTIRKDFPETWIWDELIAGY